MQATARPITCKRAPDSISCAMLRYEIELKLASRSGYSPSRLRRSVCGWRGHAWAAQQHSDTRRPPGMRQAEKQGVARFFSANMRPGMALESDTSCLQMGRQLRRVHDRLSQIFCKICRGPTVVIRTFKTDIWFDISRVRVK